MIIREYRRQYPRVVLAPEANSSVILTARLQAGAIDVAFVPPISDSSGLTFYRLVEEDIMMVLPTGHRLSNFKSAPLSALANETFVLWNRALNPGEFDTLIAACRRSGFEPVLGQLAPIVTASIPMVAAGLGVSIVPRSVARIQADGVFYLPIEGNELRVQIWLVHRRNGRSAAVQNFIACARRQAADAPVLARA
jgi:DNA-binding transcriptional LysR family regulator